ncbi:MAG: Uma2 family endonuclease [Oscillatoria princeps RMCB-10]|jgi:Uma2 family endonuclease|nr:Uma2 family endonuclease [Oscillatoria princeps RMCB-10]
MAQQLQPETEAEIIYPESDGQPMADNTKQFRWIVTIKENLEILFAAIADVFVAGDLFWYPVRGSLHRQAPDVMVVFNRPKGDRGSYKQWEEENIPPQVVFEILSPGNTVTGMTKKLLFYQRYGVEEYYIYDPDTVELTGLLRSGNNVLEEIEQMNGWVSPRLGIRFELKEDTLEIYRPDNQRFLTPVELDQLREQERQRAEQALAQLAQEQQRYQALIERLRERGIDPEQL